MDKSLTYVDIAMLRPGDRPEKSHLLPLGYRFAFYQPGDETHWADIVVSSGEFDKREEALEKFSVDFAPYPDELIHRLFFVVAPDGEYVGTTMVWEGTHLGEMLPRLHWVSVKAHCQGLGLGKALVSRGLQLVRQRYGADSDCYLTTQTWSYPAINIYRSFGFDFYEGPVAGKATDMEKAMEILAPYLREYGE
ncbi:GNAT family N-acetyltransferase [Eubacteriales bacterium OttesenSCG-928-M02]|nr:GNAT family N-acetyltransferase [Eubacteriales bacterium OttesenSCG-928-M02]